MTNTSEAIQSAQEIMLESQEPRGSFAKIAFTVPPGACDAHAHIFGPQDIYPMDAKRTFNPPAAGIEQYRSMLAALGLERAVIVHSAVYGTDNSATYDALAASNGAFRGVGLVAPDVSREQLNAMHIVGFRGVRFNLIYGRRTDQEGIQRIARKIAEFGWHVQLLLDSRTLPELVFFIRSLPVPVVIDHMGRMPVSVGVAHPGFQSLLRLLRERRCWVKLSGANRMGDPAPPYAMTAPFAKALVDTAADRLVWGSDWPHVREPGVIPDDGELLNLLGEWVPDASLRAAILCDNPAQLYDFAPLGASA